MDTDLHKDALQKYQEAQDHWSSIYDQMQDDIDFALGDSQWKDGRDYEPDKLKLVINKCPQFIHNIVNDMRASKPAINFSPVDDKADVDTAEVFKGLTRNIETVSDAPSAYDTAAFFQVTSGLGFLRVDLDWIEGTFDQEPKIRPVDNFASVMIDPTSKALDGSDMRYAFAVNDSVPKESFKEEFPDAQAADFSQYKEGWCQENTVRIAEYFYKERKERELIEVSLNGDLDVMLADDLEKYQGRAGYKFEKGDDLNDGIIRISRKRKEFIEVIKWCKLSGYEVLEKTEWIGKHIPIVPVYGNLIFNKTERHVFGIMKVLKDPQRLYNYWKSSHAETIALQPKAPWVGTAAQIEGYEEYWQNSNKKNYPYLQYNPDVDENGNPVPPPERQVPPQPSMAMAQEALDASNDMKAVTGQIYDEGQRTLGAESGTAILAKERRADANSYHYTDNQSKSIRMIGKILLDIIPKTYSGARIVRILGESGEETNVPVNQNLQKPAFKSKGDFQGIYDLQAGKYDVTVSVGPSFDSRRQESVTAILEIMRIVPNAAPLAYMALKNMDWPGADEAAEILKKTLPPELFDEEMTPERAALQSAKQAIEVLKMKLMEMDKQLKDKTRSEDMKHQVDMANVKIKAQEVAIDQFEAEIKAFEAEQAANERMQPQDFASMIQTITGISEQMEDLSTVVGLMIDDNGDPLPP